MKVDVEAEYGKEFTTFEPVSFRKQAVAQNVYYVKVRVLSDTSMAFVRNESILDDRRKIQVFFTSLINLELRKLADVHNLYMFINDIK